MNLDQMPIIETYRGVGIHDFQSRDRIDAVVKPAIDRVCGISDAGMLFDLAADVTEPPEARLFAADKYRAMHELRATAHSERLGRIELLDAHIAGLDTIRWADPARIGTLFDVSAPGSPKRPLRPAAERARLLEAQRAATPLLREFRLS